MATKTRSALKVNDIVNVVEIESPWIKGPWIGQVRGVVTTQGAGEGMMYITPIEKLKLKRYNFFPSNDYITRGLLVTSGDIVEKIDPKLSKAIKASMNNLR